MKKPCLPMQLETHTKKRVCLPVAREFSLYNGPWCDDGSNKLTKYQIPLYSLNYRASLPEGVTFHPYIVPTKFEEIDRMGVFYPKRILCRRN